MAREGLLSASTSASAPVEITSCHEQLRDLLTCHSERGVVSYISRQTVMTYDMRTSEPPKRIATLNFMPNCLTLGCGILAAGGQKADIFVSNKISPTQGQSGSTRTWSYTRTLPRPASINNAIFLTSSNLTPSSCTSSTGEPRLFVCNNDHTIKAFSVKDRSTNMESVETDMLSPCGSLNLTTAINHASISPDGRTLVAVGDTNETFLYSVNGGEAVTFEKISKYMAGTDAGFSTAWSSDGRKFAVACQDGQVTTWDTRSSKPLAMFYTLERPTSSSTASPRGFTSPPPSRRPPWTIPRRPFTQDTRRRTSSSDDALYGDRVPFPSSDSLEGTSSMRSVGGSDRMRGQSAIASSSTFTRSEHQQNTEDWDLRLPPLSGSDSVGMMIDSSGGTSSRVSSDTFQLPPTWYYTTEVIQGPAGVRGTVGASATSIPVRFSYDPSPRNPARALKFSPCQGEGELLVFTEQTTRFHVIDARTFNQHDIVKVPVYHPGHQERWASTSRSSSVDSHRTASAPGRQSWASMLGIPAQHGEDSQDISQDVDQLREDDGEDDDTEMEELAQDNPNWAGISRSLDEIGRDVDRFASGMNSHGWRPLPMFGGGARTSTSSVSSPSGPATGGYRIFAPRATSTGTPSRYALYIDSGMAGVGAGYGPEADVITWRTPPVYPGETDPQITGISFDPTGRWVYVGTEWGLYEWEVEGRRRAFGVEETGDYA